MTRAGFSGTTMIRKFLVAVLALAATATAAFGVDKKPEAPVAQPAIQQRLSDAAIAVYAGKQVCAYHTDTVFIFEVQVWGCEFKTAFTCTGTVIKKDGEGNFLGLTAGHCFTWPGVEADAYYIADSVSVEPVLHKIKIVKFEDSDRYDYAVFTFHSYTDFPAISLNEPSSGAPELGSEVINVNFALGLTKQTSIGKVTSDMISGTESKRKELSGRYMVHGLASGPGASGSAIVDMKSERIVGIVEGSFRGTEMGTIAMPTGKRLFDFLQDDSAGLKPLPEVAPKAEVAAAPELNFQAKVEAYFSELWDRIQESMMGIAIFMSIVAVLAVGIIIRALKKGAYRE
jgi:hypothetical protein